MGLISVVIIVGFALISSRGGDDLSGAGAPSGGSESTQPGTPSKPGAATTARGRRVVKMMFTGDTLVHGAVYNQAQVYGTKSGKAYDFRPMFDKVRPILSTANVAICHQETPLSADDKQLSGYPVFSTPHEIADALLDAGYDGCSTGVEPLVRSQRAGHHRHDDGVRPSRPQTSGMARHTEENARATVYSANGVTIAHLAYSYGLNGYVLPPDKPWLVRLINKDKDSPTDQPYNSQYILADAKAARAAGAELVVIKHSNGGSSIIPADSVADCTGQRVARLAGHRPRRRGTMCT
jgi:poly-gamma-glutamate synthesis protein (capsule biosynthesis protein)